MIKLDLDEMKKKNENSTIEYVSADHTLLQNLKNIPLEATEIIELKLFSRNKNNSKLLILGG